MDLVAKESAGVYSVDYAGVNGYCNIYDKAGTENRNALHMVDWDGVVRWSTSADASKFKLQDASALVAAMEKTYTIENFTNGYLSVADGYVDGSGNLKVTNNNEPANFDGLWHIMQTKEGYYRFVNAGETKKGLILNMTGSEANARAAMTAASVADDSEGSYFNGTIKLAVSYAPLLHDLPVVHIQRLSPY